MNYIKKLFILTVILLSGSMVANAQFRFGVKAGVNLNNINWSNLKGNFTKDNGCGFTGGVMTEFQIPIIGLCFDASLMYTQMTASYEDVETSDNMKEVLQQKKNFLEVPINVKYRIGLIPVLKPYVFTGPSFAFKFGGDDSVLKTKAFQCAWNVGAGLELFNHVQIGASYGFGVNNILKNVVGNTSDNIKAKNNYWTITAAYLF